MKGTQVRIALFWFLALLTFGCGENTTAPPTPNTPAANAEFAYALTESGYAVSMYSLNASTGAFTAAPTASLFTGYVFPQLGAEQMVADPLGRFAYVANLVSNASDQATISMYTINSSDGVLTATTPPTVPTGFFPQGIAIDPAGKFVYTANSDDNTLSMFTINQTTGVLTPTNPPTVSTEAQTSSGLNSSPVSLTVHPNGTFLYACNQDNGSISMFSIDATAGILTPTTPAIVLAAGTPFQVVVTPSGKFAYAVNSEGSGETTGALGVSQFTVNSTTGVLTANTPSAVRAGNGPAAVAVDPTSQYAYVVNRLDNTVSMFTIDQTTGNLLPNGTIATGIQPFRINFDPSGKFVYVTNEGSAASIYTVASGGTLTAVGTTGPTTGAFSIAISVAPQATAE